MAFDQQNYLVPPLPLHETATTTHGPDYTKPILSPYQVETDEERERAKAAAIAASERDRDQGKEKLRIDAVTQQTLADELGRQETQRAEAFEKTQENITAWTTHLAAAREKYEAAPTPSLFGDKTTGQQALFGLGMIFSAFGDAARDKASILTGRGPSDQSSLNDLIHMDLQRQRENIKGLSDKMVMAKTGLNDANQARQLALAEVDVRGGQAFKRLAQIGKARLTNQGVKDEDIKHDARIVGLESEFIKQKDGVGARLTQQVVKSGADVTTTNRDATNKDSKPSAAQLELSNTDLFNKNGEKIGTASNPKHADMLMRGNGAAGNHGAMSGYSEIRASLVALRDDQKEHGAALTPDEVIRRTALVKDVVTKMKGPEGDALGVLAGPDMAVEIGKIGGNAATYLGKGVDSVDHLIGSLDKGVSGRLGGYGIKNPDVFRRQYLMELPVDAQTNDAPPTMFIPRDQITGPTSVRDLRGTPETMPAPSLPPGPAVETPANSPDNANSEAPLPEDPIASEAPDIQPATPKRMPGVAQLGKASAVAAPTEPGQQQSARDRAIASMKMFPNLRTDAIMKRLGITAEDLR